MSRNMYIPDIRYHVTNIMCHVTISGSSKSDLERAEEDAMMEELMQLVMRRDQLMWQLDEDKTRWVWLYESGCGHLVYSKL